MTKPSNDVAREWLESQGCGMMAHDSRSILEAYPQRVASLAALIERRDLEAKIEECGDWAAEMGLRELSNDRSRLTRETFLGRTDELRAQLAALDAASKGGR